MNDELRPRLDEARLGGCAAYLTYHPTSSSSVDFLELGGMEMFSCVAKDDFDWAKGKLPGELRDMPISRQEASLLVESGSDATVRGKRKFESLAVVLLVSTNSFTSQTYC
jgi:hypothetical protein